MSWLSSLLGLDAQHNAGVAQKNATSQQALQNQYGAQGASVYGGLQAQGQQQTGVYNQDYLALLNQFGSLSGLGGNAIGGGQGQGGGIQRIPTGQGNNLYPASSTNQAGGVDAQGQNQGGPANPNDPYGLDKYQQQQLNQTNANIAQQASTAVSSFQQQMSQRGITDPRALQLGEEQIHEHFSGLQAEEQTKFYEQAKQDKLQALQSLIQGIGAYGAQGISEQEAAGGGFLGLASGAQAASNAQQNFALQQQQLGNDQLGGLLNLGGFALGGGFNSGPKPPAPVGVAGNLTGGLG